MPNPNDIPPDGPASGNRGPSGGPSGSGPPGNQGGFGPGGQGKGGPGGIGGPSGPGGPGGNGGPGGPGGKGGGPGGHGPGGPGGKGGPGGPGGKGGPGPDGKGGPGGKPPLATSLKRSLTEAFFFAPYLKPLAFLVAGVVILGFLATFLRLPLMYIPAVLTSSFDKSKKSESSFFGKLISQFELDENLITYFIIALSCLLLSGVFMLIRNYWTGIIGENLLRSIRLDVFKNLKQLSMQAVVTRGAGQFVQRLTRDLFFIRDLYNQTLAMIISSLLEIAVYVTFMMTIEPGLTLILLALFLTAVPVIMFINKKVERKAQEVQKLGEDISSSLVESIGGYRDIVAGGHFEKISSRYGDLLTRSVDASIKTRLMVQYSTLFLTVITSLIVIIPYFLAVDDMSNISKAGYIITYVGFWSQVLPAFSTLARSTSDLAIATPSLRAVRELLEPTDQNGPLSKEGDQKSAARPVEQNIKLNGPVREIRFENVGLNLNGRWVVRDLNFTIQAEKMTAIIGQSGAGKTTVFHMMLRLIKPSCGSIWINDQPLEALDDKELRKLIGFIPQSPFIFNQSLRDNLLIGVESADSEAILADAVAAAQLTELVENRRSDGGLDSSAGFMGMRLSGGERQRIALGRLLIQNPEVIVCDEYTANIDVKTAQLISDMMVSRFAKRTRVVITHELYTVAGADHVLVLEQGELIQTGSHDQLVSQPGLYRALWEAQKLE